MKSIFFAIFAFILFLAGCASPTPAAQSTPSPLPMITADTSPKPEPTTTNRPSPTPKPINCINKTISDLEQNGIGIDTTQAPLSEAGLKTIGGAEALKPELIAAINKMALKFGAEITKDFTAIVVPEYAFDQVSKSVAEQNARLKTTIQVIKYDPNNRTIFNNQGVMWLVPFVGDNGGGTEVEMIRGVTGVTEHVGGKLKPNGQVYVFVEEKDASGKIVTIVRQIPLQSDGGKMEKAMGCYGSRWVKYDDNGKMVEVMVDNPKIYPVSANRADVWRLVGAAVVAPTKDTALDKLAGLSTSEQTKARAAEYLSGKNDYSVTGPYKDYLFTQDGKALPLSHYSISSGLKGWYANYKQQGVYLGSFISESDKSIITTFGTENSSGQKVVQMFVVGFTKRPDSLPVDFPISYALVNKKWPSWMSDVKDSVPGIEIPKMLMGKENQIVSFQWFCQMNPATIDEYSSFLSRGDENAKKWLKWVATRSLSADETVNWLKSPKGDKPYGVFTRVEEIDWSRINTEKLLILRTIRIPPVY